MGVDLRTGTGDRVQRGKDANLLMIRLQIAVRADLP